MCTCIATLERLAAEKRRVADHLVKGLPGERSRSQAELGIKRAEGLAYAALKLREAATDQGDVADDGGDDDPWAAG